MAIPLLAVVPVVVGAVKTAAVAVGKAIAITAKAAGKAAVYVGKGTYNAVKTVGRGTVKAAKSAGRGVSKTANAVKNMFRTTRKAKDIYNSARGQQDEKRDGSGTVISKKALRILRGQEKKDRAQQEQLHAHQYTHEELLALKARRDHDAGGRQREMESSDDSPSDVDAA